MTDTLSVMISTWRQEAAIKNGNSIACSHLDTMGYDREKGFSKLKGELTWYLYSLINSEGDNVIQPRRAEGPEDIPILLYAVEQLKRTKARVRAIGLDMASYRRMADRYYDTIKKTLSIKPEFQEIKNAEARKDVVRLVCAELVEFMEAADEVIDMAKAVGAEYNEAFNALALEFNMLNAMSYQRGLYPQGSNAPKNY